jgi:hypothetical protein
MRIIGQSEEQARHDLCKCEGCAKLLFYPDLPPLDPPRIGSGSEDWLLACHWCGPLIDGRATLIRRGFLTDGASIPRPAWPVVGHPFQVPLLAYALPHDGDYAAELHSREECDRRFLCGMAESMGWAKRNTVWSAVRGGGWVPWGRHTKESIAFARKFCRDIGEEEYYALRKLGHLWQDAHMEETV